MVFKEYLKPLLQFITAASSRTALYGRAFTYAITQTERERLRNDSTNGNDPSDERIKVHKTGSLILNGVSLTILNNSNEPYYK
ncbi:hypothetical protein J6590_074624 [Homalodisca vitripennis]|nr:hypothetical protein J6590_074624 [Homalodisca vitripennis]